MAHNIIRGQKINRDKIVRAGELRRAMTPEERVLSEALRRNALCGLRFRRQQVVAGFIADFYCHSAALAVELDGSAHNKREDYDEDRDRILGARGVRVIRFHNGELTVDLRDVLRRIAESAGRNI